MSSYILWLDSEHAKIYPLVKGDGSSMDLVPREHNPSHIPNGQDRKLFFHKVAEDLKVATEIYVLGGKLITHEFKHHCENHNHKQVAKAIVGIDTIDGHARESEVIGKGKEFYKKLHQFTKLPV
ncbi:MAG: hypothetical protein U0T83_06200 [Bacteriovoracaceae bacterium]